MRALLDVNVLIALFDQDHAFNDLAHSWLEANSHQGIATCPLTENGLVRILSHPGYSRQLHLTPTEVIRRLHNFLKIQDHVFWADDLSLRDSQYFDREKILGSKQLTDIYLLGMAVKNGGKLVSFDKSIPLNSVERCRHENLEALF